MANTKLSREAIARVEIGHTDIDRSLSLGLVAVFLFIIFAVPVVQLIVGGNGTGGLDFAPVNDNAQLSFIEKVERNNKEILRNIDILEHDLEERSFWRKLFLPPLQFIQTRYLRQGNEKVVVADEGELFFRPSVDYLIGPPFMDPGQQRLRHENHEIWESAVQPDPVRAIVEFRNQLAARGIELIVLPVPAKPSIRPSALADKTFIRPLANRSWDEFINILASQNIIILDVRPRLAEIWRTTGNAYLATDTHWAPEAMSAIATMLGERLIGLIAEHADLPGSQEYQSLAQSILGTGDISRMLTLPAGSDLYPAAQVQIEQILTGTGEFWQPDRNSPVLLLGDSFANIYSAVSLGWGSGAGLAEQLSKVLRRSVDIIVQNDSGAFATREMLARELQRGRDRLLGKKVVVWEFAERELASGDWKKIVMELGQPIDKGFFVVEGDKSLRVTATVKSISRSPRPGSVPYRDNLITLHLVDLEGAGVGKEANQALVYALGMKDNQLTGFATVRSGDTLTLELSSWELKEPEFGSVRRTPLDDEMLELELPNWGELHEK